MELFDSLADECKSQHRCARFLEKTPQHVFHLSFILSRFPNAKIVNVVRDPRDCYVSSNSNRQVVQNSSRKNAKYWRRCIEARNRFASHPRIIDVRYEKLVNYPSDTLKPLMHWVGEEFESIQIEPELMTKDLRARAPQLRLFGKRISATSVNRWSKQLSDDEINIIEEVVGRLLYMPTFMSPLD